MPFQVSTKILDCPSMGDFFSTWHVNSSDLIITNEYVLGPHLSGQALPCDVLYQEKFGTGEPTDGMIDAMLQSAAGKQYDRVIGIGGGTILDITKLFVFGGNLSCEEIFAQGASLQRKRTMVVIPTTCGTGSEVTMISIVRFEKKNTKMGLAVPALFPDEAVIIPALLLTQPYEVFAASSIDALIHSAESFVSPKATPFSRAMARDSIERIVKGYKALKAGGGQKLPDAAGFYEFMTASTMGGIAFGNAGVGAVHALSYPVGALYHVPHGKANYMFFGAVFKAYKERGADLSLLEEILSKALECPAGSVWDVLFDLIDFILTRQTLSSLGVSEENCKEMAASVIKNQQRLLVNNPVELTEEDIGKIYLGCL